LAWRAFSPQGDQAEEVASLPDILAGLEFRYGYNREIPHDIHDKLKNDARIIAGHAPDQLVTERFESLTRITGGGSSSL
jgi:hypothetical protein